jgi:hypothetical protein
MCKPTFISRLLSGLACTLLLCAADSKSNGPNPYGVSAPSGKQWKMTFDDEFTQDNAIDASKWNGGAGGPDWCKLSWQPNKTDPAASVEEFKGKSEGCYMFRDCSDPCGQYYEGLTLSKTNGLEMWSPGYPSAAIQTGGTTAQNATGLFRSLVTGRPALRRRTAAMARVEASTPTSGCTPSRKVSRILESGCRKSMSGRGQLGLGNSKAPTTRSALLSTKMVTSTVARMDPYRSPIYPRIGTHMDCTGGTMVRDHTVLCSSIWMGSHCGRLIP